MNSNPNQYINNHPYTKIYGNNSLEKKGSFLSKIERFGYKTANLTHKFFVLSLFSFILFNVGFFIKEYNAYWRARRVISFFCLFKIKC